MNFMRQFIALTFNSSFKEELMAIMDTLKEEGIQGKYYDLDNLHMTLAFFGETDRQDEIMEIIHAIPFPEITITLREFDSCLQFFTNQIAQNVDYINAFEFFYCQICENYCTNMG